jgi:PAS domain S-box-containing protein
VISRSTKSGRPTTRRLRKRKKTGHSSSPSALSASKALADCTGEALAKLFGGLMMLVDARGTIRAIRADDETFPEHSVKGLLGKRIFTVLRGETYAPLRKLLLAAWKTRGTQTLEYALDFSGETRWFSVRVFPAESSAGLAAMVCLLSIDITDRKRAEEALRKNAAMLEQAEKLTNTGSWEWDLKTGAIAWSDNLYRLRGYAPGEVVMTKTALLQMIHPDDRQDATRLLAKVVATRHPMEHVYRSLCKGGRVRIFHTRFAALFSESGEAVRIVGSTQDITDRKLAEEKLEKSEALLAQAEQLAELGSWEWDLETNEITWSEQRYRMAGMDPRMPSPSIEAFWNMVHPADRERHRALVAQAIAGERPLEYEARFVRADGEIRVLHSRGIPVTDASGRMVHFAGMSQDVTERRNEEDRLRLSEALLDQAEEIAGFGCWDYDVASRKVILSRNLQKMYAIFSDGDFDPELYWQNVLRDDRHELRSTVLDAIGKCRPFEYTTRYRMPDRTTRVYHTRGIPVAGSDGSAVRARGVVHDVTGQIRTEEELRRLSHELLRTQDAERRQMARDLHESVGQTLAALKMTLANHDHARAENGDALAHLQEARGLAEDAIREIRVVSYLMHPPMLDEAGLTPTLEWYARGFSDRSNIQTAVEVDPDLGRFSQQIETTVFRIVQEALTNVHRYSGSQTVTIRVARQERQVLVEVSDQGCGLHSIAPGRNARLGVGIAGMRERVKQLDGIFEMESRPGHGTTVRAVLPFVPQEPQRNPAFPAENDAAESFKGE